MCGFWGFCTVWTPPVASSLPPSPLRRFGQKRLPKSRQLDSSHDDSTRVNSSRGFYDSYSDSDSRWQWLDSDFDLEDNDSRLDSTWDKLTRKTWIVCAHATSSGFSRARYSRPSIDWLRQPALVFPKSVHQRDTACTPHAAATMETAPAPAASSSIPKVIHFAYKDFRTDGKQRIAKCKVCDTTIKDKEGTTSNFVRHLKSVHEAK